MCVCFLCLLSLSLSLSLCLSVSLSVSPHTHMHRHELWPKIHVGVVVNCLSPCALDTLYKCTSLPPNMKFVSWIYMHEDRHAHTQAATQIAYMLLVASVAMVCCAPMSSSYLA